MAIRRGFLVFESRQIQLTSVSQMLYSKLFANLAQAALSATKANILQ